MLPFAESGQVALRTAYKDLPSFTGPPHLGVVSKFLFHWWQCLEIRWQIPKICSSRLMTDPCGTPLLTSVHNDSSPSTITLTFQLIRKVIKFQRFPENPYFFRIVSNRLRGTVSNAFQMSRYMTLRLLNFRLRIVIPNKWAHLVTFASPHLNITCIPFAIYGRIWPEANHKTF